MITSIMQMGAWWERMDMSMRGIRMRIEFLKAPPPGLPLEKGEEQAGEWARSGSSPASRERLGGGLMEQSHVR